MIFIINTNKEDLSMAYVMTHIDKNTGYADYVCETVADLESIPHKDFEAERIDYDKLAPQHHTITAGGMIVTYID